MRVPLLVFSILQIILCSCPPGFELVINGECRGNYTRINSFYDELAKTAISKCNEIQGQPIIIHNEEQNSYWKNHVAGGTAWTVMGLVCSSTTTRWEWADGLTVDFKPPENLLHPDFNKPCVSTYSWVLRTSDGYWGVFEGQHTAWTSDVFCTTQLQHPTPNGDGCDTFEDDSEDGVCYQIGSTAENWKEAQTICGSFGAQPASIHNLQENSFIRRLAVSMGDVKSIFLGATVSGKGNVFAWADGSEWDYDNFSPGFPLEGFGSCLAMDTEGNSGQWVNVDCNSKRSVACTRQKNYILPNCSSGLGQIEGQIIYSPGFPYDASTPCDFILTVDAGKKLELEVLMLEANSCFDNLIIFDSYVGGDLMDNLTGEVQERIYTSPSNSMRISWQPNGGVNVRGVMMTFRGV